MLAAYDTDRVRRSGARLSRQQRGRRSAQVTLPPTATSPARARRFVRDTLRAWDALGGDDVLLVVSELVTNGLLHARTPMTVTLAEAGSGTVRLSVADGSPVPLQERRFSIESGTGRGLRLLDTLAAEWGVETTAAGKTVWCVLATDDSAGAFATFDADAVEAL